MRFVRDFFEIFGDLEGKRAIAPETTIIIHTSHCVCVFCVCCVLCVFCVCVCVCVCVVYVCVCVVHVRVQESIYTHQLTKKKYGRL